MAVTLSSFSHSLEEITFFKFAEAPLDIVARTMQVMHIFSKDAACASQACKGWNQAYRVACLGWGDFQKYNFIARLSLKLKKESVDSIEKHYKMHVKIRMDTMATVIYSVLGDIESTHLRKVWAIGDLPPAASTVSPLFSVKMSEWVMVEGGPKYLLHTTKYLIESNQFEILLGYASRCSGLAAIRMVQYQLIEKKGLKCALKMLLEFKPPRLNDYYIAFLGICLLNLEDKPLEKRKEETSGVFNALLMMLEGKSLQKDVVQKLLELVLCMYPTVEALKTSEAESLFQIIAEKYSLFHRISESNVKVLCKSTWQGLNPDTKEKKAAIAIAAFKGLPCCPLKEELLRVMIYRSWTCSQFMELWPVFYAVRNEMEVDYATERLLWCFSREPREVFLAHMNDCLTRHQLFLPAVIDLFLKMSDSTGLRWGSSQTIIYHVVLAFLEQHKQLNVVACIKESKYYISHFRT